MKLEKLVSGLIVASTVLGGANSFAQNKTETKKEAKKPAEVKKPSVNPAKPAAKPTTPAQKAPANKPEAPKKDAKTDLKKPPASTAVKPVAKPTTPTTKPTASTGAAQGKMFEKVTEVEGITEYRMPNGLKVLIFPDPSKPTVTVNITYLVGSRMEGYGETGMAHLLEHMMFKGSKGHPHVPDELTEHGANPNGTTSYDRTNYFETFSATEENLNWALSLESDRMINSFIADKDLKSEFSVVRNEFESGENSPSAILEERVLSTMYLWHNYGKSTIGSKEDIEKVPIKNLQDFYKKYYQPDNAVLLVAGKIDEKHTLDLIAKYFGSIPRPTRALQPTYTIEPVQDGERAVKLNRGGDVQEVSVSYHIVAGSDKDYAAFDVINEALVNKPNGRLYKSMVKTGLATNVWADDPMMKDPGYFYLCADVLKEKSLDSAKEELLHTISAVKSNPITMEEVEKARARLTKYFEENYRNSENIGLLLSEYIAQGDWRLAFIYRDAVEKVSADDANRVFKAYFVKSNRTVGEFIPTANPVRAVAAANPNVEEIVKGYKGKAALAQAEAFDPSPDNIEKRTEKGSLPGGAKYALLAKTTRGNNVDMLITLHLGNENTMTNKATVAQLTAQMLKRGTKTKTMAQINESLDRIASSVNIYANGQSVVARIKSTHKNLGEALGIVREIFREPVFPADEFRLVKDENMTGLEQEKGEPQSIAFRQFSKVTSPYPKGHINYVMSVEEEEEALKAATIDDVKAFYNDYFNGGSANVAVVGDFDVADTKSNLNKILGNWSSKYSFTRVDNHYKDVTPVNTEFKTPDKKNAMFVAGMPFKMKDDDGDYAAMEMGNFIFGGGFLNSRLATRIRQKEGISYGVGSFTEVNPKDDMAMFASYAIYNPDNKAKLEAAWNDELNKLVTQGLTEDELKQARSGFLQYRETGRASDDALCAQLNKCLYYNRTMMWDKQFEDKIKKISVTEINNVMKKYLSKGKMSYIKAGDFK